MIAKNIQRTSWFSEFNNDDKLKIKLFEKCITKNTCPFDKPTFIILISLK